MLRLVETCQGKQDELIKLGDYSSLSLGFMFQLTWYHSLCFKIMIMVYKDLYVFFFFFFFVFGMDSTPIALVNKNLPSLLWFSFSVPSVVKENTKPFLAKPPQEI